MTAPHTTSPAADTSAINARWLRTYAGWHLKGSEPVTVQRLDRGGGSSCQVHRIRCGDRSLIYKSPPQADSMWGDWIIDAGADIRELRTYRFLQSHGPAAHQLAPRCHWSGLDTNGRGAMLLDDLGDAPDHTSIAQGLTYGRAEAAVSALAGLHALSATSTAHPPSPHPWLLSASSAPLLTALRAGLDDLPRAWAACRPDAQPILAHTIGNAGLEAIVRGSHHGAHLSAVCHGDLWAGNLLFPATPVQQRVSARLIDWQFTMWGNPLSDFGFLLASSLHSAQLLAWREPLLRHYHRTLTQRSGLRYSLAACREDLARAQPFVAISVLASLDGFTSEMNPAERTRFAQRMMPALRWATRYTTRPDQTPPTPAQEAR